MNSKRYIFEIDDSFIRKIERDKKNYLGLMIDFLKTGDEATKRSLSVRYGTTSMARTESYDKVTLNVEGDTVFKR